MKEKPNRIFQGKDHILKDLGNGLVRLVPKHKPPIEITNKYELLGSKKGLYVKQLEDADNPCFVVAGGGSLKDFDKDLLANKTTIVSNKSIFDVPDANYFITTDYTFLNWLKKENLYEAWKQTKAIKFFVVNCISNTIQIKNGVAVDTRYNLTYDLKDFDKIIICKSAKNIGYSFEEFNSGYNSGFSSFQLGVLLGYNPIYLLGMDMISDGNKTHYHKGYGKSVKKMNENLNNYCKHFLYVLERMKIEKSEIKIISCSPISELNTVCEHKTIEGVL